MVDEKEIAKFWKSERVYERALELRKHGERYIFVDGPPYPTGEVHIGTAWNKILKDIIIRFKLLQGFLCKVRAGWDVHGLPTEVLTEKKLRIKSKREIEGNIDAFVKACRRNATRFVSAMTRDFVSLGVWMDFDDPYITCTREYIARCWETIARANELGLLYKGLYPVMVCPRCVTSLANYELEYADIEDPSVWIRFAIEGKKNEFLVVWTTTPWTLIGNVAIMAHPLERYVRYRVRRATYILARACLERFDAVVGQRGRVIEEFAGKQLDGVKYVHPLQPLLPQLAIERTVVMSDEYVTMEEGSGLVHCAPAHGAEDFAVGRAHGLQTISCVGLDGKFTSQAGAFAGLSVFAANRKVIAALRRARALLAAKTIVHRYPRCWRCKTQLIQLATPQWFIAISRIRDRLLAANASVEWVPRHAKVWFEDFVQSARDWCISRQRYWGIPLPIWECECGETKVARVAEIPSTIELHRPEIDSVTFQCKCGKTARRVEDIADVWFDSGNAVWASTYDGKYERAHLVIEGKDQIRGWFYTLLACGVILNDEAPYQKVGMHGHAVDERGLAMHKSLGNYVPLSEVLKKYPADAFRLWCASNVVWEDLKMIWKEIDTAAADLRTIENVGIYITRFWTKGESKERAIEDEWLASKLNRLIKTVTEALEGVKIHIAARELRKFAIEDVSRFYLKLAKRRKDINMLASTYLTFLKLLAPIAPFTAEYLYRQIYRETEKADSIFFLDWPKHHEPSIDALLEAQFNTARTIIEATNDLRARAQIPLRQPLKEIIIATKSIELCESMKRLSEIVKFLTNVKDVKIEEEIPIALDPKVAELGPKVVTAIKELRATSIEKFLTGKVEVEGKEIEFSKYFHVERPGYVARIEPFGVVFLNTQIEPALAEERILAEIRRRIQQMRKDLGLIERDKINVFIVGPEEVVNIAQRELKELKEKVNAKEIQFTQGGKDKKKWKIGTLEIEIGIDVIP